VRSVTGTPGTPSVFISYAREDAPVVMRFAEAFRAEGVDVRIDVEFLRPGEDWAQTIGQHLAAADALVVIVSPASRTSDYVQTELAAFAGASRRPIFPIIIEGAEPSDLAPALARYQALVVDSVANIAPAVNLIVERLQGMEPEAALSDEASVRAEQLADDIAVDRRRPLPKAPTADRRIFMVHGHDLQLRDEVSEFLNTLGLEPVVLAQADAGARTIVDKFETLAAQAAFAVIVMSADDLGASRRQYELGPDAGSNTLKFRARENVILELGFFYGRLGWENVFVVQGPTPRAWPDFERPSDLAGVDFFTIGGERDWREGLSERLTRAGLRSDESA
jgi:predicted nucleotide-binding protein